MCKYLMNDPTITAAEVVGTDGFPFLAEPYVLVRFGNRSEELFSFDRFDVGFAAQEFIGLTRKEALILKTKRELEHLLENRFVSA